jgi:hypothetical protein
MGYTAREAGRERGREREREERETEGEEGCYGIYIERATESQKRLGHVSNTLATQLQHNSNTLATQ